MPFLCGVEAFRAKEYQLLSSCVLSCLSILHKQKSIGVKPRYLMILGAIISAFSVMGGRKFRPSTHRKK